MKYSAINLDFARKIELSERMRSEGHDPWFGTCPDTRRGRYRVIKPGRNRVGCLWHENGAGFGMEIRDPTFDKRVMEYCLSIPADQYVRNGVDRFLIRRAMEGLLPPKVLWNRSRGRQAADLGPRLRACWPQLQAALKEVAKSPLAREILDIPRMRTILAGLRDSVDPSITAQCGPILTRGLMAGLFLLRFDQPTVSRSRRSGSHSSHKRLGKSNLPI